jgi:hypothetical protein
MLHRNNKMVWAGVNRHNLHTDCNGHWCCGRKQNKWSPQLFCLCIQQQLKYVINMEDNDDWLANNKTWKKWTRIGDGDSLSNAGIDFHKPIDEEHLVKENKRRKKCDNRKLDNNRKQAVQKRSVEYPDQLKQVEINKKWKEFTNLIQVTYMTYKGRKYGEKDER